MARGSMKESQLHAVLPSSTFPDITHGSILTLTPWDYLHQRHGKCCPSTSPEVELSNHVENNLLAKREFSIKSELFPMISKWAISKPKL